MKKIALDLDGVVFDSENLYRVYSEIYDVDKFKTNNIIDNSQRLYQKRYNWSEEEFKIFYDNTADLVLRSANLMSGVEVVLKKLMKNYKFIIITSRNKYETNIALDKLKKVGLTDFEVFFDEPSKINRLIEEKCDYIIDDDIDICRNASMKGITGIYFKNAAAEFVSDNDYFKLVNNWGEIYKYLMLG